MKINFQFNIRFILFAILCVSFLMTLEHFRLRKKFFDEKIHLHIEREGTAIEICNTFKVLERRWQGFANQYEQGFYNKNTNDNPETRRIKNKSIASKWYKRALYAQNGAIAANNNAKYHNDMRNKYANAARFPWLSLPNDPEEPSYTTNYNGYVDTEND